MRSIHLVRNALFLIAALLASRPAAAQRVEASPFIGFRTGGVVSTINGQPVADTPHGSSFGAVVDIAVGPPQEGGKVEFLFSRQQQDLRVSPSPGAPPINARMQVDHMLFGGLYDISPGRIRPFLAGGIGLTRFAAPDETSIDFMVSGGAGAKFYANRHFGARIDGRLYVTILDATLTGVCAGGCVLGFRVSPATQFELSAGLVFGF